MKILAIGAHPDDIEAGCAGTLIKYAENGHDIYLLVMTDGGGGGDGKLRVSEQMKSCKIIGVKEIFWGGHKDTKIMADQDTIQKIEEVIKKVRPSFIFTHYFDDTHQDHRHLSNATISAARYTKNMLFYEGPTTQNFTPTIFVDIDSSLEKKNDCLKAHSSQIDKTNIAGVSILNVVYSQANFRGVQGKVKNAEGFVPLRLFINIIEGVGN